MIMHPSMQTVVVRARWAVEIGMDSSNPETLFVRSVLFAYGLCQSVSGTGPLEP